MHVGTVWNHPEMHYKETQPILQGDRSNRLEQMLTVCFVLECPKTFSMSHFQPLTQHVLLSSKAFRPFLDVYANQRQSEAGFGLQGASSAPSECNTESRPQPLCLPTAFTELVTFIWPSVSIH